MDVPGRREGRSGRGAAVAHGSPRLRAESPHRHLRLL